MTRGFTAQCHFRTIDAKNSGIAARGAASGDNGGARQKAQFHEPPDEIFFETAETVEDGLLAFEQIHESCRTRNGFTVAAGGSPIETELHYSSRIVRSLDAVKGAAFSIQRSAISSIPGTVETSASRGGFPGVTRCRQGLHQR